MFANYKNGFKLIQKELIFIYYLLRLHSDKQMPLTTQLVL